MLEVTKLDAMNYDHWMMIKETIMKAAPKTQRVTKEMMVNMRAEMVRGKINGWLYSNGSPMAVLLTMITEDAILDKREMLIYAASGLKKLSLTDMVHGLKKLKEYAADQGCTHITAYSIVPTVVKIAKLLGGDVDTRYISMPLEG
jgi:hypothetical protein